MKLLVFMLVLGLTLADQGSSVLSESSPILGSGLELGYRHFLNKLSNNNLRKFESHSKNHNGTHISELRDTTNKTIRMTVNNEGNQIGSMNNGPKVEVNDVGGNNIGSVQNMTFNFPNFGSFQSANASSSPSITNSNNGFSNIDFHSLLFKRFNSNIIGSQVGQVNNADFSGLGAILARDVSEINQTVHENEMKKPNLDLHSSVIKRLNSFITGSQVGQVNNDDFSGFGGVFMRDVSEVNETLVRENEVKKPNSDVHPSVIKRLNSFITGSQVGQVNNDDFSGFGGVFMRDASKVNETLAHENEMKKPNLDLHQALIKRLNSFITGSQVGQVNNDDFSGFGGVFMRDASEVNETSVHENEIKKPEVVSVESLLKVSREDDDGGFEPIDY